MMKDLIKALKGLDRLVLLILVSLTLMFLYIILFGNSTSGDLEDSNQNIQEDVTSDYVNPLLTDPVSKEIVDSIKGLENLIEDVPYEGGNFYADILPFTEGDTVTILVEVDEGEDLSEFNKWFRQYNAEINVESIYVKKQTFDSSIEGDNFKIE